MPESRVFPEPAALLPDAAMRLVRTVDGLRPEEWSGASLLPGWTRAHVVAHLVLNAEALAGVLRGVVAGEPVPMYRSQEARDADVEALAAEVLADPAGDGAAAARERLLGGTTAFADALAAVPPDRAATTFERTPGGRTSEVWQVVGMRLREVEVHHADLGAGYRPADWPLAFAVHLLETMTGRVGTALRVRATDVDRTWDVGTGAAGGPLVSGTAADLAWWLTGRGTGEALTSDDGVLPRIEEW